MRSILFATLVLGACTEASDFGPAPCTPGEQRACACPGGGPPGVQVCSAAGNQFEACGGCESTTTGFDPSSSESSAATTLSTSTTITTDPGATDSVDTTAGDTTTGVPGDGIPDGPPQAVPPAPPPDGSAVVNEVAAEHPDWLQNSCVEQGGNNDFLFEVVRRLRMQDDRWGLNWKRGVVGDLSQDVVDYHWGEGVSEESLEVYIIDMIGGHCPKDATPPSAAWIDVTQATADAGTVGMWTLAGQDL